MLPPPDWLEWSLADGDICLLTDDGSTLTGRLATALHQLGWPIVVLSFPPEISQAGQYDDMFAQFHLHDSSELALAETLARIGEIHGRVGAYIHLSPLSTTQGEQLWNEAERAMAKLVFLTAKELHAPLTEAAADGSACFVTVSRLDGMLGTGDYESGAMAGGLAGLAKTLNREWPDVFCRHLDFHPNLDVDSIVEHIIAECHDPQRIVAEVGHGPQGRITLVVE